MVGSAVKKAMARALPQAAMALVIGLGVVGMESCAPAEETRRLGADAKQGVETQNVAAPSIQEQFGASESSNSLTDWGAAEGGAWHEASFIPHEPAGEIEGLSRRIVSDMENRGLADNAEGLGVIETANRKDGELPFGYVWEGPDGTRWNVFVADAGVYANPIEHGGERLYSAAVLSEQGAPAPPNLGLSAARSLESYRVFEVDRLDAGSLVSWAQANLGVIEGAEGEAGNDGGEAHEPLVAEPGRAARAPAQ